jgi:two-component system phosphate regulon response regulator PhoB
MNSRPNARSVERSTELSNSKNDAMDLITPNAVKPMNLDAERILVVEDESEIRELIALLLKREGHDVDAVASAEEAEPLLARGGYGLVALDWMLPGTSGVEITRRLRFRRDRADLAILMITARAEPADIVEGLEAGADDYLSKPFEPSVLLARVRALLRRNRRKLTSDQSEPDSLIQIDGLSIDPGNYEVKVEGELITLTPSEFKLLFTLAQNRGRVLTRESLIQHVQGEGVSVVGRTVDTHVFGLRKKLGACADVIETVRGIGYRVKAQGEGPQA